MKKLLLILAMILPMFITSCSDDEETTVLSGTTWESTEEYDGIVNARWTLSFQGTTFGLVFEGDENADGIMERHESTSGNYTVNGNEVTLKSSDYNSRGTFTETVMHFPEGEYNEDFVFYKK